MEFCQSSFGDFIRHAFINSYQVNCVGSSYSDLWYIITLDYHSVPTIQLFRNLLADHAQTCPLFYDGTFCFTVGCISDYIENLFCTTLTIQLLLLLYVIASLVFLAVFYFILGNIISLSVGVLLKFASDNMDRPIIIGTLLDPVVSYQLTIQIHPVTTQAIVIIFGFRSLFMLATTWLIPYTPLQLDLLLHFKSHLTSTSSLIPKVSVCSTTWHDIQYVIVWINIYFLSLGPIGLSQGHNLQCASTLTSIIFFVWQLVLGTGSCVKFQALLMLHLRKRVPFIVVHYI